MNKEANRNPRVQITLSQSDYDDLKELSGALDEPMSKVAGQMIHHGIKISSAQVKAFNKSVSDGDSPLIMVSKLFKSALNSLNTIVEDELSEEEIKKLEQK